uniref:Putative zn finger n=1 Tax=Lutzomyia longipalpis TaxID=7200 RepID=A0A1B0CC43_LUTLO
MDIVQSQIKEELLEIELRCINCGSMFEDAAQVEKHREICHITPYSCKTCLKEEASLQGFESHLQHHGGIKLFKCIICQEMFTFLWELNMHLPIHLPDEKEQQDFHEGFSDCENSLPLPDEKEDEKDEKIKEEDYVHTSHDFNDASDAIDEEKLFSKEKKLKKKTTQNTEIQMTKRKRGRPQKIKKDAADVKEKRFHCPHCLHSSKTFSNLKKHIRTHSGTKPFECALCGNCYSDKYALRDHLLMKHVQMKQLSEVCSYCGKAFRLRKGLRVHIRTQHTSKEQYSCFVCGKIYASKNSVDLHIRTHSIQPGGHSCPKCGKNFARRDLMLQHHRHIHIFKLPSALRNHVRRIHQERTLPCPYCDKKYGFKADLTRHVRNSHSLKSI